MSSVNGCFNPNSVCLGSCFLSSRIISVSIFIGPESVSSVNGCFNPNSVCLGSCFLSSRIIRVSTFIGPRMCPRLMVALAQTLLVWPVCFILLDHEDNWF